MHHLLMGNSQSIVHRVNCNRNVSPIMSVNLWCHYSSVMTSNLMSLLGSTRRTKLIEMAKYSEAKYSIFNAEFPYKSVHDAPFADE